MNTEIVKETTGEEKAAMTIGRAKQLFGMNQSIKSMTKHLDQLKSKTEEAVAADEADVLTKRIAQYTLEQLKNITVPELNDIYTTEDGPISLILGFETPEKENVFKRDFLIYLKESETARASIDAQLKELDTIFEESKEEFQALMNEFGDFDTFVQSELRKRLESATTDEARVNAERALTAYEYAWSLENVYQSYFDRGTANTLEDYKRRSDTVYKRFMKTVKALNLTTDITRFGGLEDVLAERFRKYPNLFVFAVMKYMAYLPNPTKAVDGVFLTSLLVNIRDLMQAEGDKAELSEKQKGLKASMEKVLDLFITEG